MSGHSRLLVCIAAFAAVSSYKVGSAQAPLPEPLPGIAVDPGAMAAGDAPDRAPDTIVRRRLLKIRGHNAFVLYAQGLQDVFDLPLYRDLGFNTVVIDIPWQDPLSFESPDALLKSAVRMGLGAIVQVHAGQPPESLHLRIDRNSLSYARASTQYLEAVARHYREAPGVDAIMFEDDAEQHLDVDNSGFQTFLGMKYTSLGALNQDWGSAFTDPTQLTMEAATQLSVLQYDGMSAPGLLVGEYRGGSYNAILRLWADIIREADPFHPILSGRQDLPRSAIQTPRICSGVVVAAAPPDPLPVDIGRRAGQFVTIVALSTGDSRAPDRVRGFLMRCMLHGSGGVAFPNWDVISGDKDLQASLRPLLKDMAAAAPGLRSPQSGCAIVYQPLAPGTPEGGPAAPFGYMPQPADQEPSLLMRTLARGTLYGFADILSADDLLPSVLSRYRVIFLPSVFSLPRGSVESLAQYVSDGGVVVADLGLNLHDLHYLQSPWPLPLSALFGLQATVPIQYGKFEYPPREKSREPAGLLDWYPLNSKPDLFPSLVDSVLRNQVNNPTPFSGPRGFAVTVLKADVSVFGYNPPQRDPATVSGLFVRRLGQGCAIFATFRLWSQWSPDGQLFGIIHGDLIARGAGSSLDPVDPNSANVQFTPTPGGGFELLGMSQDIVTGAVRLQGSALSLRTSCVMQTLPTTPPSASAYVSLLPSRPVACEATPITIGLQQGYVTMALDEYSPGEIRLKVCGTGSTVRNVDGKLHLVPAGPADATITIRDGLYSIVPGSRHTAIVKDLQPGGATRAITLEAGQDGAIALTGHFIATSIVITPQ